jgi:hypothetical protein
MLFGNLTRFFVQNLKIRRDTKFFRVAADFFVRGFLQAKIFAVGRNHDCTGVYGNLKIRL